MKILGSLLSWVGELAKSHDKELCGLLLGYKPRPPMISGIAMTPNMASDPAHQYAVDPEWVNDYFRVNVHYEMLGIWHSHPITSSEPSEVDQGLAVNGYLYLITSGVDGKSQLWSPSLLEERLEPV